MRKKLTMKIYVCKSCNKRLYITSDQEFDGICKTCKQPVVFSSEQPYDPKSGLRAIKASNNQKMNIGTTNTKLIVEYPYCHSTNTKKISGFSKVGRIALFGIYGAGKLTKQWHCKNCNSDF